MVRITFIAAAVALCQSVIADKSYTFSIGWVTAAPDGFSRPVIGINGKWPIPAIEANVGERITVKVTNNLGNETTSLHFHGLRQFHTNEMDGPSMVTQCPIPPGQLRRASYHDMLTSWFQALH
jgi:iron transport multicopper oxidase